MSITRRTLLRSAASLPATYALSGCRHSEVSAPGKPMVVAGPAPDSIFVLLAGPWLIYPAPSKADPNQIGAISVDDSMKDGQGNSVHKCSVEKWQNGSSAPQPSPALPDLIPDSAGLVGATISVSSYSPANYSPANSFAGLFSNPFNFDQFAWISNRSNGEPSVNWQKKTDRAVFLSMPTAVYVGGFLINVTVTQQPGQSVLRASNVNPHVVTIFEYAPLPGGNPPPTLSLTLPGSTTGFSFAAGEHLVFHMQHLGKGRTCDDDRNHLIWVFNFLTSHLSSNPLLLNINDQLAFEQFRVGNHTSGIAQPELPIQFTACNSKSDTFANCAGGGIVVGP